MVTSAVQSGSTKSDEQHIQITIPSIHTRRQISGLRRTAVAIANNGAGDQLLVLRSDDRFDAAVYCWSHDTGELAKVAEDFGALQRL
jgi:hypothetical protein